jgi:hypothetical protein
VQKDIVQALKENCQIRLQYPATLFFKMKEEIKNLQDKHKLREFMATNLALQNILK